MQDKLNSATSCPICGGPMMHSRLGGYRCHMERHNDLRREMQQRAIGRWPFMEEPDNWQEIILKEMGIQRPPKRIITWE